MQNKKSTKRALITSALSLVLCMSMLIGTTFAWFTDNVTSKGNKIQSGTLKVDLEVLDKDNGTWKSVKDSKEAIFTYELWEPGYTEVKVLKVQNEGSLALKWKAQLVSSSAISDLANVIDVYVKENVSSYPTTRNLESDGWTKLDGTLADFINTIETTTTGNLAAGSEETLGIAFKMQESAGNEYQGETLGAFDIRILATQDAVESDSFGSDYDNKAVYEEDVQVEEQPWHELDAVKEDTFIDGEGNTYAADYQEVCLAGDADLTIKGVTFQNGLTVYTNGDVSGTVTLEDCTIYLNNGTGNPNYSLNMHYADYGLYIGAIDKDVTYVFKNCTFTAYDNHTYTNADNNSYNVYIGGNYSANSITFEGCTFEGSGKHGIGCAYAYSTDESNPFTYYNLTVTGCNFKDWNNNNQNGAAIRGNVPADVLTTYNKSINISGNTFGNSNGSNKANVAIDGWTGTWN